MIYMIVYMSWFFFRFQQLQQNECEDPAANAEDGGNAESEVQPEAMETAEEATPDVPASDICAERQTEADVDVKTERAATPEKSESPPAAVASEVPTLPTPIMDMVNNPLAYLASIMDKSKMPDIKT